MDLPETVLLQKMPDGYTSKEYALTIGKEYRVFGEMGSCVVIEDDLGQRGSIHWSRFVTPNIPA